jgi:hypothetical protein
LKILLVADRCAAEVVQHVRGGELEISHLIVEVLRRTALLNGDLQAAPLLGAHFPSEGMFHCLFQPRSGRFLFLFRSDGWRRD